MPRTLWIGTYPPAGIGTPPGRGEGIYRVRLAADGTLSEPVRLVETPAPSFVVQRPGGGVLYAADESQPGRVAAFRVHDEALEPLGTASSGGAFPCHLAVDGDRLYAANYGDGALGVLALAPDGRFAADEPQVLRHAGAGPCTDRQDGPHAHFVVRGPGGHVLVVDLGTDQVRRYARTPGGLEPAGIAATLPPGTGPRHLAFQGCAASPPEGSGGRFAYVTGELDSTVHVLAWDPATDSGEVVQTLPATGPGMAGTGTPPAPSHVAQHGAELTVAVRGAGVLARFVVGDDGLLARRTDQPLPTGTPRHFAVVGPWTVVAEQVPGAVTVLASDGAVVATRALPSASSVVPAG
jgi:6-phosphogluconolactonase (cycloisomerase 2 family)